MLFVKTDNVNFLPYPGRPSVLQKKEKIATIQGVKRQISKVWFTNPFAFVSPEAKLL